jgi:hypothetical protein
VRARKELTMTNLEQVVASARKSLTDALKRQDLVSLDRAIAQATQGARILDEEGDERNAALVRGWIAYSRRIRGFLLRKLAIIQTVGDGNSSARAGEIAISRDYLNTVLEALELAMDFIDVLLELPRPREELARPIQEILRDVRRGLQKLDVDDDADDDED